MLVACAASDRRAPAKPPPEATIAPVSSPTREAKAQSAAPAKPAKPAEPVSPARTSVSVGSPQDGRLRNAAALPERGPGFRHHPDKPPERRYGTTELVAAIMRAAKRADEALPGSELSIGDIGFEGGGPARGHASHQNGRDVDIMFFLLDAHNKPRPGHPIPLDLKGEGTDYRDLKAGDDDVPVRLDVPRTWRFVEALVGDPDAHIQRIFVAEHIRAMLLEHAGAISAPDAAVARFADVTCQPSSPHDDHFHIRFFCSAADVREGCTDRSPIYPWQEEYLATQGVEAKLAEPLPGPSPHVKTEAQARAEAGALHPDVEAFLSRRKAWSHPSRTDRKWCW